MTAVGGGILLIVVGVGLVAFGAMKDDLKRAFERSYPLSVAYAITSMALIVFGIAWLIQAAVPG